MFDTIKSKIDPTQFYATMEEFLANIDKPSDIASRGLAHLKLLDFDNLFASDGDARALTCGESDMISENQTKEYIKTLFNDNNANLNFVATCNCGRLTGNFYTGIICPKCGVEVHTNFANELKYRLWLEIPEFMPPILHPVAYRVFNEDWLRGIKSVPVMDYLLDVDLNLPPALGQLGQGFKYFHDNFDDIVNFFMTKYNPPSADYKERSINIPKFIEMYRDRLFVRHVPILNQSLHLITRSGSMSYSDLCSKHFLKARIELSKAVYAYHNSPVGPSFLDQRLFTIYQSYSAYVDNIIKVKLTGKHGFIRKCVLGSRYHSTFRGVISPLSGPHTSDEMKIPWRVGVVILKAEIFNFLTHKYKLNPDQALTKIKRAIHVYDNDIAEIFKQLFRDCPYKGLPVLWNRNPSMVLGSIQLFFVVDIKTNLDDNTISWSYRVVKAANADYDGDAYKIIGRCNSNIAVYLFFPPGCPNTILATT